uniref:HAT C-terminal dimerisation domain-containing protein n=1 Tax=Romanomermis culicivorax TaxID=13658 RepID=A0A915K112_ROMCU
MATSAKRKSGEHRFVKSWLSDKRFKGWLTESKDGSAYCKVCPTNIRPKQDALIDHLKTKKHLKAVEDFNALSSTMSLTSKNFTIESKSAALKLKTMELKLSVFIAEHNSLRTIDHLGDLIKNLFPDDYNANKLKLHRTKCAALIVKVLSPSLRAELLDIIDECTDVATQKTLGIMIRLICLTSGTAEVISGEILKLLEIDKLNMENLVGIGVDNANVMVGQHNSVYSKLKEKQPKLILMRCVCHSLTLAASKAVEKLPTELEALIEQTYCWFSHSAKRQGTYQQISKEERSFSVENLAKWYNEAKIKAFLIFILPVLKSICALNLQFQSTSQNPLSLIQNLTTLYQLLIEKVIVPGHFIGVSTKNIAEYPFDQYLRSPQMLELNYEFNEYIIKNNLCPKDKEVLILCRSFLVELCHQIRNRLPSSVNALEHLRFFEPKKVLSVHHSNSQIELLLRHLPVDSSRIYDALSEYNVLVKGEWTTAKVNNLVDFWTEVIQDDETNGVSPRFGNISSFAMAPLSLPFSNTSVERAFSLLNILKTKLRNRLFVKTVSALLTVRFLLAWRNENCYSFTVNKKMLDLCTSKIYDRDTDADIQICDDNNEVSETENYIE